MLQSKLGNELLNIWSISLKYFVHDSITLHNQQCSAQKHAGEKRTVAKIEKKKEKTITILKKRRKELNFVIWTELVYRWSFEYLLPLLTNTLIYDDINCWLHILSEHPLWGLMDHSPHAEYSEKNPNSQLLLSSKTPHMRSHNKWLGCTTFRVVPLMRKYPHVLVASIYYSCQFSFSQIPGFLNLTWFANPLEILTNKQVLVSRSFFRFSGIKAHDQDSLWHVCYENIAKIVQVQWFMRQIFQFLGLPARPKCH